MEVGNDNFPEKLSPCTGRRRGKSYEFLVDHMRDNMIVDDAAALKLKPDAVPDIFKILDLSYAATTARWVRRNRYKN